MPYQGVVALMISVGIIYSFFHFVLGVEAYTLFTLMLAKLLILTKWMLARVTWELVVAFVVNFFKVSLLKFVTTQLPTVLLRPVMWILFTDIRGRRRLRAYMKKLGEYWRSLWHPPYLFVKTVYQRLFGAHAWVAFVLSCLLAVLSFIYSVYYFQFEFFIWIGSFGPIASILRFVQREVWFVLNYLKRSFYRLPKLAALMAFLAYMWKTRVAPVMPSLEAARKRIFYRSLRSARKSRKYSLRVYVRFDRLRRLRLREWQKRSEALELERLHPFLRHCESFGLKGLAEYQRLWRDSVRLESDHLYLKAFLGAEVRGSVLHRRYVVERNSR